ncbi:SH protein [Menghai virus]|uniref:SH protein n=1 Tax=Menghai virus TaxID=1919071 RepID=A0A1L2YVG7_9RHAB|nr:SH protein [Menghai virus]APF29059.1 SH protein [Menghai virus]QSL97710.1 SH protein [Menghai virus]QSL97716.1 SH protein [Menghai virus]
MTKNIRTILSDFILRQKIAKDIGEDKKGFYYSRIDGPIMN